MEKTSRCQNELPVMLVPDLNITNQKFKEWAAPFLTKEEQNTTKKVVEHFLQQGGDGPRLQQKLTEWSHQHTDSNWSAPAWKALYLDSRASLVINHNVFYYLKNKLDEKACSQANMASALIVSAFHFISLLDRQELAADFQKETPLCMNQYNNIFSSIRIPHQKRDKFKVSSCRRHIVVLHKQHIYKIDILDEVGQIRSGSAVEHELNRILGVSGTGQNLGILTSLPRDLWAQSRNELFKLSRTNKQAMTIIEEAAFALCLDENEPEELTDVSRHLLHGDGRDRFFDKSLQFIVFKNAKTGLNFEHSGVDGSTVQRLIGYLYDTMGKDPHRYFIVNKETNNALQEVKFELNKSLKETISKAAIAFKQHVANTQTRVLTFKSFGKNKIRKFAISPDAFVQLALQLAEYKLYGKCYSAYEAIMTRTFLDGRIDVLYTVSPESLAFIEKMQNAGCPVQDKIDALILATQKHIERAKECRSGQGVYSHLLALKYHYDASGRELGMEKLPDLFTDKGFQVLTNSVVCTSTTSAYGVVLAGYGPIVDHGYGIMYFTRKDEIYFNMTSRTVMQDKLDKMHDYIEQSLLEMADLMGQRKI
ncbi:MAG: carnitine O-acetyltransferase [Psychromonas sp.]|jgi:carnitine O-acetyltransferase